MATDDFSLTDFRLPTAVQLSGSTVLITFGVGLTFTDPSQSLLEAYVTLDRPLNIAAQPLTYSVPHGTPITFGGPYQTFSPYIFYTGQGGADTPQLLGLNETFAGGSYSGSLPLGAITKGGSYNVVSLTVEDRTGQIQTYTTQQLAAQGFATSFMVSGGGPPSDFDGNARSDILWQNANGAVSTWHATGSGVSDGIVKDTFDAQVATSWHAVDSFDFNGDGRADILWRNDDGTLAVWDSTATGFNQSSYIERPPASNVIVAAADFDGGGQGDVLFRGSDGSLRVERSTGNSLQNDYSHASVGNAWQVEGAADFTGDGKADILWRNADGSLSIWDATGSRTGGISFQENSWFHAPIAASWHVVGLGDFNGDGRADILWRNDNGAVSVWTSTGAGGFAENQFNAAAASNWSVAEVGDFNGDGLSDILWRNTAGQISIWHSTGSGWTQNSYFDGSVGTDWTIAAHQFPLSTGA